MTTITFDTYKFIQTLREAGFEEKQAEAVTRAFKEAQGEADLVTKADHRELNTQMGGEVRALRAEMKDMETRLTAAMTTMETRLTGETKLLRWMMGATFGGVLFILLRLFLPLTH